MFNSVQARHIRGTQVSDSYVGSFISMNSVSVHLIHLSYCYDLFNYNDIVVRLNNFRFI